MLLKLERNNASTGAGFLEQKGESYVVRADGRLETVDQIANVVLSTRGGIPLYVKDVATVALAKNFARAVPAKTVMKSWLVQR
jgi:cobalt-zinc-cadmium resistance protein CzcA